MTKPTTTPTHRKKLMRTWPLLTPTVGLLLLWAFVPLAMTLWFSFQRYNLLDPTITGFAGWSNYKFLLESPAFLISIFNELVLVGAVLIITLVLGVAFAVLFDQEFIGRSIARLLVIAPFFVMPTVAALIWKNLLMDPVNGVFAYLARLLGFTPVDWFTHYPMAGVVMIVAWEWVPFATLILLTAMQSLDRQQVEAAKMDGARGPQILRYVILPHLSRPLTIVMMMETIYLLAVFAEIFVTTSGGPGNATTTLTYLIYLRALVSFNVGGASAGGVLAVILANIVALFLIRTVARNVDL
ncbi:carbohydrate ABC transporter permease [Acidocella aminolytica]|uniref:Transporter n=1 Tax=Acidocella aminolytica 101 = DSM 11237 TaxID=1120923 RepID=A0A0D6PJH7_9PROT|nr:sugar ABC transporter permease [Acidocella aminolytica]GAN81930.1 transporter [Acidocella aminolytica 101 = DSM 11237]SHE76792.1 sorbitol/mannitol transport system permease protein [Acidocella aminolytica 101 = DSM 11237]